MDQITKGSTLQTGMPQAYKAQKSPDVAAPSGSRNPLEAPFWQQRLKKLWQWRRQARVAQADNRMDMAIDEDFYDGIQYEPADLDLLRERNQSPLVFNITKNVVNWILGTERRSRIDYRVLPRKKDGAQSAKAKTKLMKYIMDVSKGEFERSFAFEESVKAGLGWLEMAAHNNDRSRIFIKSERWRNMWFDHLGLSLDASDWRYVIREKWVDLDVAQGLFPEMEHDLRVLAEGVNSLYPYLPDDVVITDNASEFDLESDLDSLFGGPFDGARERVKLVECWYRMPDKVQVMSARGQDTPYGALDGVIFRPEEADHQYLVRGKYFSVAESMQMTVRCAIWAGATYLQDMLTPYNHNRFPFIPVFCYRRKRDNMPYGVIRDIRDPQSDLNKRKSRSLFILSSNRIMHEKDAIDDKVKFLEEVNRPDGMAEVAVGALTGNKVREVKNLAEAQAHVAMAKDDQDFVHSIVGVTYENEGKSTHDLSGKAIANLQSQGQTTSGVFFDNLFYAFLNCGEIGLSLSEQFYDKEEEIRITGDQQKDEFVQINERGEDGKVKNSIVESKADFIINKQDWRETIRLAAMQMLTEIIMNLAKSGMAQVSLALLDEVIDMMDDLPNKDELVARIRKINQQHASEDDMDPKQKAEFQKSEQAQQQKAEQLEALQMAMAQVGLAIKQAEASGKAAKALKDQVEASAKKLDEFLKALQVAQSVQLNPQLVEAADELIKEAEAAPSGGGRELTRPGNGNGQGGV